MTNRMDLMGYEVTARGRRTNLTGLLAIEMASKDKETRQTVAKYIRQATSRNYDRGFGTVTRLGTPPRAKTHARLMMQAKIGITGAAKRIVRYDAEGKPYSAGHPTKRRFDVYA